MKKSLTLAVLAAFLLAAPTLAQRKDLKYKLYGFVRTELYYNDRENLAPVEGNFYLWPLDHSYDADGKDLNRHFNGDFYSFTSRVGMDLSGPGLLGAESSAKIEADFGGFSSSNTMLRVRQAYIQLSWKNDNLLVGQTWHPMFGSVMPTVLSIACGAPFQPFNRSPQIRYQHQADKVKLTTSALWQYQYTSSGPQGGSEEYIRQGCLPELFAGADWKPNSHVLTGAGFHFISIAPRTSSVWNDKTYKVSERMSTYSYEAHFQYHTDDFTFAAKTTMASSLDHCGMMGGYGVTSIDKQTGKQDYTAFRHSSSWINFVYGKNWQPDLFIGYSKNLGTEKELVSSKSIYGKGLNIDQLLFINPGLCYHKAQWEVGVEYTMATAWYGDITASDGKVRDTHTVTNNHFLAMMMYHF
jgi:hypothetical protein